MFVRSLFVVMLALAAVGASAQISPPVPSAAPPRVIAIDRVIAVVNDEAITQYELDDAKRIVVQQLKQQNVQQPAADVLDKQVLERLITERALLQHAKDSGVKVDDSQVERAIQRIAEVAGMELRVFLRDQNLDIMEEFVSNNGKSRAIPVFVFYTKDLEYLTHWTERSASAHACLCGQQ